MHFDRLVDEIYEAAIVPERWKGVLDRLANLADAEGALLFAAAPGQPRWLSSDNIRSRVELWVNSPFYQNDPRGQRLVPIKEPRFLTDLDAPAQEQRSLQTFLDFISQAVAGESRLLFRDYLCCFCVALRQGWRILRAGAAL